MADNDNSRSLSAARLERAFLALQECQKRMELLSEGTCIQFSLEADEDQLETCLNYFRQESVKLEFLGVSPSGLRNMQLTAAVPSLD